MDKPWKTHLLSKVVKSNPGAYRCYMGSKDLAINLSTARSRAWKDPWSPPLQTVQRDFKQIMVETATHLSKWCFYCFAVGIRNHVVNDANAKASYVSPLARPGLDLLPGLFHLLRNLLSLPARQWLDLEICAFDGILDDFSSDFSETFPFQTMKSLLSLTSGISVCVCVFIHTYWIILMYNLSLLPQSKTRFSGLLGKTRTPAAPTIGRFWHHAMVTGNAFEDTSLCEASPNNSKSTV